MVVDNNLLAQGRLTEAYNESEILTEKDTVKMNMMDKEWQNAEAKVEEEMMQEKQDEGDAHMNKLESFWEKAMRDYNPEDPQMLDKQQSEWNGVLDNWDTTEDAMQKHWNIASDIDEMQYGNLKDNYAFNKNNPYENIANPHKEFIGIFL